MRPVQIILSLASILATATSLSLPTSPHGGPLVTRAKPTGGPASTKVTVYSGPYTCVNKSTPPPTDGSAGTATVVNVAEDQCAILSIPLTGAITASLTASPKTGAAGCYVQIYSASGCGLTLENEYHGFPFDGTSVGSKVGCVAPPVKAYGAVSIVCA